MTLTQLGAFVVVARPGSVRAVMHLMHDPRSGVPPSRFRPPVYVTIWS